MHALNRLSLSGQYCVCLLEQVPTTLLQNPYKDLQHFLCQSGQLKETMFLILRAKAPHFERPHAPSTGYAIHPPSPEGPYPENQHNRAGNRAAPACVSGALQGDSAGDRNFPRLKPCLRDRQSGKKRVIPRVQCLP